MKQLYSKFESQPIFILKKSIVEVSPTMTTIWNKKGKGHFSLDFKFYETDRDNDSFEKHVQDLLERCYNTDYQVVSHYLSETLNAKFLSHFARLFAYARWGRVAHPLIPFYHLFLEYEKEVGKGIKLITEEFIEAYKNKRFSQFGDLLFPEGLTIEELFWHDLNTFGYSGYVKSLIDMMRAFKEEEKASRIENLLHKDVDWQKDLAQRVRLTFHLIDLF